MATQTKNTALTMRISSSLNRKIDKFAKQSGRSKSYVAHKAIEEYLSWRIPQLEQLKDRVAEADLGKFVSQKEMESFFRKYGS